MNFRFQRALIDRIVRLLAREAAQEAVIPTRDERVSTPRVRGQASTYEGRSTWTGRQANLNPRPAQRMSTVLLGSDQVALGDTARRGEGLMMMTRRRGVPISGGGCDLANVFAPSIVGNVLRSYGERDGWRMVGNIAYVIVKHSEDPGERLLALDWTDPANPVLLGVGQFSNNVNPRDVEIRQGYAYVTSSFGNVLTVFDVRDPTNIQEVATLRSREYLNLAITIRIRGRYAFVEGRYHDTNDHRLTVLDVDDPLNPTPVAKLRLFPSHPTQNPASVGFIGDYLYFNIIEGQQYGLGGYLVVDVSDPLNPVVAAEEVPVDIRIHEIVGSYGLRERRGIPSEPIENGFETYSLRDPLSPQLVGQLDLTNTLWTYDFIACSTKYAYAWGSLAGEDGNRHHHFVTIGIANPAAPSIVNIEEHDFGIRGSAKMANNKIYLIAIEEYFDLEDSMRFQAIA